jgi:replicative DNA helicase
MSIDKKVPYDLDSEESVLGSCLIDSEAIFKVIDFLKPSDFYRDKNIWVFEAILECFGRREAINQTTVAYEIKRAGRLEALGGAAYLGNLIMNVPTSVHVVYYANIVKNNSVMRSLITAGGQIADIGYEAPADENEAISRAMGTILKFTKDNNDGCVPVSQITGESSEEALGIVDGKNIMPGISTGFKRLDYSIGGWQKGMFTVIAARPSMGKTNVAICSLMKSSTEDAVGVLFSLETPKRRIVTRMAFMQAGINEFQLRNDIRTNKLSPTEKEEIKTRLTEAYGVIHDMPIMIEDGRMSVIQLEAKIRRLQMEHNIGVVFIDHMGKLVDGIEQQRYQRISGISNKLSSMCLACDIPVVALCQLSRDTEGKDRKEDRKPRMSDLRDSGVIEEDARIILGLYRESYYNEQTTQPELMECMVLKYNEGEAFNTVPLKYEQNTRRIYDWPASEEYLLQDKPKP